MEQKKSEQLEPLAKTSSNEFKANYMQNIRKQRKKRAIAENQ